MNHTILTDTDFFNRIHSSEYKELPSAYNEFVARVIEHCHSEAEMKHIAVVDTTHFADAVYHFNKVDGIACPLQGWSIVLFVGGWI